MAALGGCRLTDAVAADPPAGALAAPGPVAGPAATASGWDGFLSKLEKRTFRYFWERTNPANGLVPDRWPTPSFSSIAATGFGLTAYTIGAERGYVPRAKAARRALTTLEFFLAAPQGPQAEGMSGYKGFFYHFLDMNTGHRYRDVELSTIDTALLAAGALSCQSYFDRDDPTEAAIRARAEELVTRIDWQWASAKNPPLVNHGWTPEVGYLPHEWIGYTEAMILYIIALGSPTFPLDEQAWPAFCSTYPWDEFYGQEYVQFSHLFGHQFTLAWIDGRGIRDEYMRGRGIDYFENSRRATYAQRAYAIANPMGWKDYGELIWGFTACDGPADATHTYNGEPRQFFKYAARGAGADGIRDDGTIAPYAAGSSIVFAPEIVVPALREMKRRYGGRLWSTYGFRDAFNPSFSWTPEVGRVGKKGWVGPDYLGIDQGPLLLMLENYRSGLVWNTMRRNPHIVRGLRRAGFSGGWLDSAAAAP
ncbi:MAG: Tat pathway signal protein [Acidobacteria bacterium]|nr:Tat pathway signal protein [Acidobacteriota bacterium]